MLQGCKKLGYVVYSNYGYHVTRGPAQQYVPHKERLKARGAAAEPSVCPGTPFPQERQEAAREPRYRVPQVPCGSVCERLFLAWPQALRQVQGAIHPWGLLAPQVCPEQRAGSGEYIGPPGLGLEGRGGMGVLHHRQRPEHQA